jgi:thymidine kinase
MLTVVGGPMFSGKTTWLIEYTKKLEPQTFVIFKPNIDTRYATHAIVTHNGQSLPAQAINYTKPIFPRLNKKIRVILIDELNFFSYQTLFPQVVRQQQLGRDIVGVGLLYDSNKKTFGATLPLMAHADKTYELLSLCDNCGQKTARHSYRKIKTKSQIAIGAGESYGPSCDECWSVLTLSSKNIP